MCKTQLTSKCLLCTFDDALVNDFYTLNLCFLFSGKIVNLESWQNVPLFTREALSYFLRLQNVQQCKCTRFIIYTLYMSIHLMFDYKEICKINCCDIFSAHNVSIVHIDTT